MSNSAFYVVILYLTLVLFWQGSSCKQSKMKANSDNNNQKQSEVSGVQKALPTGQWGGEHVALDVAENGATIDYDCAHGTIDEKIVSDGNGKFSVKGMHIKEHFGPVRKDDDLTVEPAIYTGIQDGKNLTLTVTLTRSKETVGTYILKHGVPGRVRKCA